MDQLVVFSVVFCVFIFALGAWVLKINVSCALGGGKLAKITHFFKLKPVEILFRHQTAMNFRTNLLDKTLSVCLGVHRI